MQIGYIRQHVGWVYPDLLWFSEEESKLANQQREELLQALSGWVTYSSQGAKPHSGSLSPGCLICGHGGWGCNLINGLCTRHCFYCPQDHSIQVEHDSSTDAVAFKDPAEHILFMEAFQIRGVGFSGGEPLLVLDRLLAHIQAIREKFGNSIYIWMYTNGDLLDRLVLKKLREAGLDEIRLDLSARKYDLEPVTLAKQYFSTVTVEIPAIPEDCGLLKSLLGKMERMGVDFLNLHQLMASQFNYKELCQRHYHFLHQPNIPVFESEICALQLLLFARENTIRLPINYCCAAYKDRFQGRDRRTRVSKWGLENFEEITDAGYIRSIHVVDSPDQIDRLIRRFQEAHCSSNLWQCHQSKMEVSIHRDLVPYVDWSSAHVSIRYCKTEIGVKNPEGRMMMGNLAPQKFVVNQRNGWSLVGIESWRKLYIEKMNTKDVFRFFFQNYPAHGKDSISKMREEAEELKKIAFWEQVESGLPEVF